MEIHGNTVGHPAESFQVGWWEMKQREREEQNKSEYKTRNRDSRVIFICL